MFLGVLIDMWLVSWLIGWLLVKFFGYSDGCFIGWFVGQLDVLRSVGSLVS